MGDITHDFSRWEIECPCNCGNVDISMFLMNHLQVIRSAIGRPMTVTSGVRCEEYNLSVGGVEDSEHVPTDGRPGEGIDIACDDSYLRWEMVRLGMMIFKRVGLGDGFVHFGVRPTKDQRVLWTYY